MFQTGLWPSSAGIFFLLALQPPLGVVFYSLVGFSLLACEVSWSHTTTRHIRQDSSERMISPSQRPLPDNIQHSQQTNIHSPGGIRTHNLSKRAAEDLRLRPRGHWDRLQQALLFWIKVKLQIEWKIFLKMTKRMVETCRDNVRKLTL